MFLFMLCGLILPNVDFPANCPASGQSGQASASCQSSTTSSTSGSSSTSSNTGAPGSSSSSWVGQWTTNNQCSQTQCCCLSGTLSIASINNRANLQLTSSVSGQCGSQQQIQIAIPTPSGTTYQGSILGNNHQITLNGNTLTDTNLDASVCSGQATKVSAGNSVRPSTAMSAGVLLLVPVIILLLCS